VALASSAQHDCRLTTNTCDCLTGDAGLSMRSSSDTRWVIFMAALKPEPIRRSGEAAEIDWGKWGCGPSGCGMVTVPQIRPEITGCADLHGRVIERRSTGF